ncbi:hypothetical protein [Eubacterium ramulus]|uniref:hypothetical protein n=1 Tax=Eubacterium ramulus TaxID=39490 RepID=UPI0022E91B4A|nr:hypothetical protein [Eubacterium ramulus]
MVLMTGQDYSEWSKNCEKFEKNKKGIGFTVGCHLEEGKIKVKLSNLGEFDKPSIRKKLQDLAVEICRGGVLYINHVYLQNEYYLPEDGIAEGKRMQEVISGKMEYLMQTLLQEGLEVFSDIVQKNYKMFVMQYEITKIQYMNGKWVLPNGNVWNGELFVDENGSEYHDLFTDCWRSFLAA